jgi:hypothetical protein
MCPATDGGEAVALAWALERVEILGGRCGDAQGRETGSFFQDPIGLPEASFNGSLF